MNDLNRRMDERYEVSVPVVVRQGKRVIYAQTQDVSMRGLFALTEDPPELRQLLQLTIAVAPDNRRLELHGMAVHQVRASNPAGRAPGVGVQFYAVDSTTLIEWAKFVHWVQKTRTQALIPSPPLAPRPPEHRRFDRFAAELELEVHTMGELHTLYSRDLSAGGMFIVTELDLPVGEVLRVQVIHPGTRASFALVAAVRRVSRGVLHGLGVEFLEMTDETRRAFFDFVARGGDARGAPQELQVSAL